MKEQPVYVEVTSKPAMIKISPEYAVWQNVSNSVHLARWEDDHIVWDVTKDCEVIGVIVCWNISHKLRKLVRVIPGYTIRINMDTLGVSICQCHREHDA